MNEPTRIYTPEDLDIDGRVVMAIEWLYAPYCGICHCSFAREVLTGDEQAAYQWAYEHLLLHQAAGEVVA